MNNSEKQAAAFEPKWTREEPETRQTPTAIVHPRSSETPEKRILIGACPTRHVCACLQTRLSLDERPTEASQSALLYFLILSGTAAQTENQTKIEPEWTDTPPHLSLTLPPSLSPPLNLPSPLLHFHASIRLIPSRSTSLSPVPAGLPAPPVGLQPGSVC